MTLFHWKITSVNKSATQMVQLTQKKLRVWLMQLFFLSDLINQNSRLGRKWRLWIVEGLNWSFFLYHNMKPRSACENVEAIWNGLVHLFFFDFNYMHNNMNTEIQIDYISNIFSIKNYNFYLVMEWCNTQSYKNKISTSLNCSKCDDYIHHKQK